MKWTIYLYRRINQHVEIETIFYKKWVFTRQLDICLIESLATRACKFIYYLGSRHLFSKARDSTGEYHSLITVLTVKPRTQEKSSEIFATDWMWDETAKETSKLQQPERNGLLWLDTKLQYSTRWHIHVHVIFLNKSSILLLSSTEIVLFLFQTYFSGAHGF